MGIFDQLAQLLSIKFGLDTSNINLDTNFKDDLNADSLDIVELLMELEDEFDIKIGDQAAEGFTTVKDVVDYIENSI